MIFATDRVTIGGFGQATTLLFGVADFARDADFVGLLSSNQPVIVLIAFLERRQVVGELVGIIAGELGQCGGFKQRQHDGEQYGPNRDLLNVFES